MILLVSINSKRIYLQILVEELSIEVQNNVVTLDTSLNKTKR